ncbi:MAG: nucleotidyltransferase family protein [Candidatus Riflebacteria bacterium]|nr:nucleotidyltransferase family protein [Candidatus Riflebacteria bacterium]
MMKIPPDFKDFLKLLNENEVRYLLVGGYAVGYHGYVRSTGDLDIWIEPEPDNADRVMAVLARFGFGGATLRKESLVKDDQIIRMGISPLRIELLTSIDGVAFAECFAARIVDQIDGVTVNVIDLEHLRINKRAAGRHKDLDDLENLE